MLIVLVFLLSCVNIYSTIIRVRVDFTWDNFNSSCESEYNGGENILNIIDFYENHMNPEIKPNYDMKNFRVTRAYGFKGNNFIDISYEYDAGIIKFNDNISEFDNVDILIYTELFLSRFLSIKFSRDIFCCPFNIAEDIDFDSSKLQIEINDLVESLGKGKIRDYIANLIFQCVQTHLREGSKRKYSGVIMSLRTFLREGGKGFILPKCSTTVKLTVITPEGFKLKPEVVNNFKDFETAFELDFNSDMNNLLEKNIYELKSTIRYKIPILDHSEKDDIIEFCDNFEFQKEIKVKLYLCERSKYLDTINVDLKFKAPKGFEVDKKLRDLDGNYIIPIESNRPVSDIEVYTKVILAVAKEHGISENNRVKVPFQALMNFVGREKFANMQSFNDIDKTKPVPLLWDVSEIDSSYNLIKKVTVDGNKDYQIQDSDRKSTTNNIGLPNNSCCLSCCKCCRCSGSCC